MGQSLVFSAHKAKTLCFVPRAECTSREQECQAAEDVHAEPRNSLDEVQGHQEGVHEGAFALVRQVSSLCFEQVYFIVALLSPLCRHTSLHVSALYVSCAFAVSHPISFVTIVWGLGVPLLVCNIMG